MKEECLIRIIQCIFKQILNIHLKRVNIHLKKVNIHSNYSMNIQTENFEYSKSQNANSNIQNKNFLAFE